MWRSPGQRRRSARADLAGCGDLMGYLRGIRSVFFRNGPLVAIMALAFFSMLIMSAIVAYALLLSSPSLVTFFTDMMGSVSGYVAIPPPYTSGLYRLIFLNNIGHFWNPVRVWVWLPFVGMLSLGFELVLNAVVIGGVISLVTLTKGGAYAVAGLLPHGIFEIPAFILEFAGLARWHVTTTRAIYAKLSGGRIDRPLLIQGVKDTLVLSFTSVALFAIAAYVETYVTPHFLGL
jgi:stage II sporulation protein M